ncbi:SBBP repeat-containing protein [Mechercharimyces sp. CAU 1602]|nr:SBBP repeat-containing protein [Mechercharimyces sp. CAU 1602]
MQLSFAKRGLLHEKPISLLFKGANLRTNISYFSGDRGEGIYYSNLWEGVDAYFYERGSGLKYDFLVRPGIPPGKISLNYCGVHDLSLTKMGDLIVSTPSGCLIEKAPTSFQQRNGDTIEEIPTNFILREDGTIGFSFREGYDPRYPLLVDPFILYSTYLGGNRMDIGQGIVVDSSGNAYVTGQTNSSNFPITSGSFQQTKASNNDLFISKINNTGTSLLYSTFLGGNQTDEGRGIALDREDNAYVTGFTRSTNFPITLGALQSIFGGATDAFISKLNASGNDLLYSTYLGGSSNDLARGITVNASNEAFVTGATSSTNFPISTDAFQTRLRGDLNAFVSKINNSATAIVYSSYLGGKQRDLGNGIVVDEVNHSYVVGETSSTDFPVTSGVFQSMNNGASNGFISKINATGNSLLYSTYLGGSFSDVILCVDVDVSKEAYVIGTATSLNFPVTIGAFQTKFAGEAEAFVTKINDAASQLIYSTFIGGSNLDGGIGIGVDPFGNAWVTGFTESSDFPISPNAFSPRLTGTQSAFVSQVSLTGANLIFSSYLGGNGFDDSGGIAVDEVSNAYVTGLTDSTNFPTTPGAFQRQLLGECNVFVTKIGQPIVEGATGPTGPPGSRGPRGARGPRGGGGEFSG